MNILENVRLAPYTTFKIGGPARHFCAVASEDDLIEAATFAKANKLPIFVLGGGSNLLVSDAGFSGLVIKMSIKGVTYEGTRITAAAGEMWDDIVEGAVSRGLYGIENLSAIPGTVGATAVQNIGAYGADISTSIESVRAFDMATMNFVDMSNTDCQFAYRDSVFKHSKNRYVITRVSYLLKKDGVVDISYKDLAVRFVQPTNASSETSMSLPSLREVRDAVIDIRWNKLPDWKLWGTAGSFFKNPVIDLQHFIELKQKYPDLPGYTEPDGRVKVSLGWIIDKVCHMKGEGTDKVRTYDKQALVVVAQTGATAMEVVAFTHMLMMCVKDKTGIQIEAEVEWVN